MSISTMPKITAYIIAFNEAEKIAAAVNSVLWADEIIVADSGSTDGMVEIAESLGARVIQIPFKGFGDLRNQAIAACTNDWIFSLDADERCTPEARDEILKVIADPASVDIYFMPRRNFFMGRWIKHSGWYPNYRQPQLFRRGKMGYTLEPVHEGYISHSERPEGHLQQPIWQLPFKNLDEVVHKVNRYPGWVPKNWLRAGVPAAWGVLLPMAPGLSSNTMSSSWVRLTVGLALSSHSLTSSRRSIVMPRASRWIRTGRCPKAGRSNAIPDAGQLSRTPGKLPG
jgi:glycosyltransferase involved in cell wall biosynthesis